MFLTLDYYLKKSHIFKNRKAKYVKFFPEDNIKKYFSIISIKKQRFEFVYIRTLKKFLRKSYCKTKMRFFKPKFWLKIFINAILTKKSKNARMGAGVGVFHRGYTLAQPNMMLLWLKFFFIRQTLKILKFIKFKTKLFIKLLNNACYFTN